MRTDQLYVVVRPRGLLECLDLAVMFCGRRPAAVVFAMALGAVPFMLANRFLFGDPEVADPFDGYLLLGIEAAWASAPLTLYLGQAVFAERFSWRLAIRNLAGSLPAMLVFQGLLRGICLSVVVLAPVVFIGMYYLNQIILLERPRLRKIWGRRTALQQRSLGRLCSLALVDALLLVCGAPLAMEFLAAVSAAWAGRSVSWLGADGSDGAGGAPLFSWPGQIAFWSICGFLTVFRFFTYLDARIRREGWDVELKLRSDATYAGVTADSPRRFRAETARHPVTVAGASVVLALVATGWVAQAAAPAHDTSEGDVARRALARHSFPWYDAGQDRYLPLIRSDGGESRAADAAPRSSQDRGHGTGPRDSGGGHGGEAGDGSSSTRGGGGDASGGQVGASPPPSSPALPTLAPGGMGVILMVALLVSAILAAIYLVVRYGLGRREPSDTEVTGEGTGDEVHEDPRAALPAGAGLAARDLIAQAAFHADRGDFEQAMVFFHAWQLVELDHRGGLALGSGKTNGQYVAEVTAAAPELASVFRRSSRLFEDAFFGDLRVPRDAFLAVWGERDRVATFRRSTGD